VKNESATSADLQVNDGALVVSGVIDLSTVTEILADGRAAINAVSDGSLTLDLSAVTRTDSAGLALVVDWVRVARQRGLDLKIVGASSQLSAIAQVSGLDDLLQQA
jgi:phospholipid transport system transporter-binding protein